MARNSTNEPPDRIVAAYASTDCPTCGGFVALAGSGRKGERVRLSGTCPNGHLVFVIHVIR